MLEQRLVDPRAHFEGKRVLITGGCGFIASHLAAQLAGYGAEVRLFDTRSTYFGPHEFVQGDVLDTQAIYDAVEGCQVVFHFAALLGVEKILNIPLDVLEVNERGTINVLEASRQHNVERFVLASSSEIYGEPRRVPVAEDELPSPVSVYGVSKLAAEAYTRGYAQTHGLPTTILRFFNVYGPGQAENFVVPRFVGRVARGEVPEIYGEGDQIRAYTYVGDAVEGVIVAACHPNAVNDTFNIGSNEVATVAKLAQTVLEVAGSSIKPQYKRFGDGIRTAKREIYTRMPNTRKARQLLGFRSNISLSEGIARCLAYHKNGNGIVKEPATLVKPAPQAV